MRSSNIEHAHVHEGRWVEAATRNEDGGRRWLWYVEVTAKLVHPQDCEVEWASVSAHHHLCSAGCWLPSCCPGVVQSLIPLHTVLVVRVARVAWRGSLWLLAATGCGGGQCQQRLRPHAQWRADRRHEIRDVPALSSSIARPGSSSGCQASAAGVMPTARSAPQSVVYASACMRLAGHEVYKCYLNVLEVGHALAFGRSCQSSAMLVFISIHMTSVPPCQEYQAGGPCPGRTLGKQVLHKCAFYQLADAIA
jgi:hypothetical protein